MRVGFSINQYDEDGEVFDECVLLHLENTILRFNSLTEVIAFRNAINTCIDEIEALN